MSTKLTKCARCGVRRKQVRRLAVTVNVVVNYQTKERRDFASGDALCVRCWHSLDPLYGGLSEGSKINTRHHTNTHFYVRESDGVPIWQCQPN